MHDECENSQRRRERNEKGSGSETETEDLLLLHATHNPEDREGTPNAPTSLEELLPE